MKLDQTTRDVLRQFKPGTPIMSQSGGYIGHVVRYHMVEVKIVDITDYKFTSIGNRWEYKLIVIWADDLYGKESIVDIDDVQLL